MTDSLIDKRRRWRPHLDPKETKKRPHPDPEGKNNRLNLMVFVFIFICNPRS